MRFGYFAGAVGRCLAAPKDGPSLYEVCDPVLAAPGGGDPHIAKFYRTALGNPALRLLLRRAGLPELKDQGTMARLRAALAKARHDASPDWEMVARPVADLLDTIDLDHPKPAPAPTNTWSPKPSDIDRVIRACADHLLGAYHSRGFIPTYAAFSLIGDPDLRGRDFLHALTGLNSRGYKNSTLLFNLARVFIAKSAARAVISPPWKGVAEPMWQPVQIRHRSAYYDAFFIEALLAFVESGLASPAQAAASKRAIADMVDFCLTISREQVRGADSASYDVVTALAPAPHPRFSRFFAQIKQDLGFDIYVPDCDTTACSVSAARQAGTTEAMLDQPLIDFYAGYQVRSGENQPRVTVPLNDNIDYDGGIVTWIDNLAGERPYGNDLDPTLNLDVLEVSFRHVKEWKILEQPKRLATIHGIIDFQRRLVSSDAFSNPRSHIYYLPELYCAYFGRCHATFMALPPAARAALDPHDSFGLIRERVLAYVQNELIAREMNVFDAALALLALTHLGAETFTFAPALSCILSALGEGGRHGPFRAYEWNKMKTPTRILVGGPEVTSAFVLMALVLAKKRMMD